MQAAGSFVYYPFRDLFVYCINKMDITLTVRHQTTLYFYDALE